jgi:cohesin loading factor subunit SCC2
VDFVRYMAENFAAFEYKTQEEVFTVIKSLTTVLSTTGMQLLDIVSPSHLLTHLQAAENGQTASAAPPTQATTRDPLALMRTSVIIAIVMLLKSYLKTLYSLSEE